MNLRYRLFLWIGSLFLLAFVASFFLESVITRGKLERAKKMLRSNIMDLSENRRKNVEKFLAVSIAEEQSEISALLQNISEYVQLYMGFSPTENALLHGTWFASATSLVANKWIDFIQNTDEGQLTSLIVPKNSAMLGGCQIQIDEDISWVSLEGHEPYIGVRFFMDPGKDIIPLFRFLPGVNPDVYVLFNVGNITPFLESWRNRYHQAFLAPFFEALTRASDYLKEMPSNPKEKQTWIETKMAAAKIPEIPNLPVRCIPDIDPQINKTLSELLIKNDEVFMIWRIASLLLEGPFSKNSPLGIARFPLGQTEGEGLLLKDIFYDKPLFNDAQYYSENKPILNCWHPALSIAVINPPELQHVFLGNTLKTSLEGKTGYLTIGRDIDALLTKLVLSINQTGFIVHQGRIISAFNQKGKKITDLQSLPVDSMLSSKSGELTWNGEKFFYLHMIPFSFLDLHFFTLNPEEKEFAFVNELDSAAKQLIESLSFDMRAIACISLLVVLLLLHHLSKRISKPITHLAHAAKDVGAGRLDDISLPAPSGGRYDEISMLCESFAEMVKGLKEKEKVQGVLNKVVSQEIAEEILKGNVHLGGEEKVVTVLFADIRNFTEMTSKMAPIQVIEMLNKCMTKISKVVDLNGGVIDKYVGDEVMALFGAPIEKPDSAMRAVESAWEMLGVLNIWNVERKAKDLPLIEMGIGIHTGNMLAGNMGAENRLNYTVLGRNVNLASRLCSAASGGEILITRSTYEAPGVKELIDVEALSPMMFKGFSEAVEVYKIKALKKLR